MVHVLEPKLCLAARSYAIRGRSNPVRSPREEGLRVESGMVRVICQQNFIGFGIFGDNKVTVVIFVNAHPLAQCPLVNTRMSTKIFSSVNMKKLSGFISHIFRNELLEASSSWGQFLANKADAHAFFLVCYGAEACLSRD